MILTKTNQDKFRKLASLGHGDDTIFDTAGNLWVVFRLASFEIHILSVSNRYEDVKVIR